MSIAASRARPSGGRPTVPNYPHWQAALADAVTDPVELGRLLGLAPSIGEQAAEVLKTNDGRAGFSLLVPRPLLGRMAYGDPLDPLLLQVLPRREETVPSRGFTVDPLGETPERRSPKLLAKYQNRSLILTTGACGVHCRFCFRRHFPYVACSDQADEWGPTLAALRGDPSIHEVILSGGDPLMLDNDDLRRLLWQLSQIPHIRRLRVHTRLPVLIPQRVDDGLVEMLAGTRLPTRMVIHVNHPAEIDGPVGSAIGRLVDAGIPILSQSVLLRGVNDRAEVLTELFLRLIDLRVTPYYLHQLDRVASAAHFEVPIEEGIRLVDQLRAQLPGYAVPRYVRETPGQGSKKVLA